MKHATLLPQDEALLRRTITAGLSDDEHAVFVRTCNRSGLDPFARQIYISRRRNETQFLATINGFRLTAERTGKYTGQLGPHWCGPDGVWKSVWTAQEPPAAARIGVLRSDFKKPVWGKAIYSEFSQGGEFWEGMPCNQLAKCAEAMAFRKAFPKELSGLYTTEEMQRVSVSARRSLPSVRESDAEQGNVIAMPEPTPAQSVNVPLPLQPFIERGFADRENVSACWEFLRGELKAALGDSGGQIWATIYRSSHRLYPSKDAQAQAILKLWCEAWKYIERAKREAA